MLSSMIIWETKWWRKKEKTKGNNEKGKSLQQRLDTKVDEGAAIETTKEQQTSTQTSELGTK